MTQWQSKFPARMEDPVSLYEGVRSPGRPRSENLIAFMRSGSQALQPVSLSNRLHHRHVIYLVLETPGSVIVDGLEHRLEPGQAYYVRPFQFHHRLHTQQTVDLRWAVLTFDLLDGADNIAPMSDRPLRTGKEERDLWSEILRLWKAPAESERAGVLPLFDSLLFRLGRRNWDVGGAVPATSWASRAVGLVMDSVHRGGTIEDLAARMGMSGRHFRSRFAAAMGVSVREYRALYQLNRAFSLLRDPDLPLSRVSKLSGFNSQPVFNRFIRRCTGSTPGDLRRRGNGTRSGTPENGVESQQIEVDHGKGEN